MERHSISSWSQEMQPPKVREAKTAIQKPLCRLCECPTSDGHVLASQVDRFKLRKWAMKIMNLTERDENLPEVVKEDDLICYFCIWQAEIGDESGDEAVAWWPKNLDLEENARVLRENYSVGEVEQCWVQLEEVVDLAKYEKEIPKKRSGECFYCGKRYCNLRQHVKLMHKKAIKCGIRGCTAYFNTEKDKKRHMQHHLHEKYNETCGSKNFWCKFCEILTFYSKVTSWRQHMNYKHPELVACTHYGCKEYFKSKSEMIQHINSCHKQAINRYLFHCKYCEYFTTLKDSLRKHEEAKHMPKMFKCDLCDASFGSKDRVSIHYKQNHTFHVCKSCGQDVTLSYKTTHRRPSVCTKCKLQFKCSGLYQLHRKSCQLVVSCKECGESFNMFWKLNQHLSKVHTETANFRCEHCDYSTKNKMYMWRHVQRSHFPKMIKCEVCNKLFTSEYFLNAHKYLRHEYVNCAECAQEIIRQNMFNHLTIKTCRHCQCKFKCSGLLEKHVCLEGNNFRCGKCLKIYKNRKGLYNHFVMKHIHK